jgi:hypothetical protein
MNELEMDAVLEIEEKEVQEVNEGRNNHRKQLEHEE